MEAFSDNICFTLLSNFILPAGEAVTMMAVVLKEKVLPGFGLIPFKLS